MQSRRVRAGIVLLLAVIALGAAGAAVDTTGSGGGGSGLGEGSATGVGGGENPGFQFGDQELNPLFPGSILATIIGLLAVGGMVVAVVSVVLTILDRDLKRLLELAKRAVAYTVMVVIAVVVLYFLLELFAFSEGGGSTGAFGDGAEGVSETASDTGVAIPPIVGVGIVVAVLLLLVFVARSTGDDEEPSAQVAPDPGEPAPRSGDGVASAADVGRPPADNEVYRAWLSLANAANANARRNTPEEVADSAVAAGVDEEAAREITALFESVRYGGRDLGDGVEQRAERARASLAGER